MLRFAPSSNVVPLATPEPERWVPRLLNIFDQIDDAKTILQLEAGEISVDELDPPDHTTQG